MSSAGRGRERSGRRVVLALLLALWVAVCAVLAAGLVSLARYIWAPLPPGYPPGEMPEGQGEGMALVFLFAPGVLLLAGLLVAPVAIALAGSRRRPGARRAHEGRAGL